MAQILIRDLSERTVKRLKALAESRGRSLEGVAREILKQEAERTTPQEMRRIIEKWRRHFAGRTFSDSAALIREDRDSR